MVRKRPPRKGNKLVPNYEDYCYMKYGDPQSSEDGRPTTDFKGYKDKLLDMLRKSKDEE